MRVIEDIIALVEGIITGYVFGAFENLSPTVEALWRILFIIFIAFYGYRVIFGGEFYLNDFIVNTLKIVVILILATTWSTFSVFLYDSFTQLPNEVAGRVLAGGGSSVAGTPTAADTQTADNALGDFFRQGIDAGNAIIADVGWREVGKYFYALMIWGVVGIFAAYALMLIVIAKLAVAILLALAPIFILLLMFNVSRGFFEGWFRALVNYAMIPVFLYALLALVLRLIIGPLQTLTANASAGQDLMTYIAPFALLSIVGFVLMLQVPTLAAGIAGGFALSTMAFAGNVGRAVGRMASGGRVGREVREAGYLRATAGLQRALTSARTGGLGASSSMLRGPSSPGAGGPQRAVPSAGTPTGAARPAASARPTPSRVN